ncbi:MAG: cupin domain-containing protein [Halieaceae bacterium]|jgi:hypothetical protein|nr:cupin domain-containing protein [Halieaceae bacterium]
MPALTEHLLSTKTSHLSASEAIAFPEDALEWGLAMMARNGSEAAMQMSPAPGADVIHLPAEDAGRLQTFRERILEGLPVHGRLALIDFCSGEGTLRDQADWAWQAFHTEFREPLERVHPLGFYMMAMLWMSAGEHVYGAHCDLADGFLMHMHGEKRVKVWPLPESARAAPVFTFGDFEQRRQLPPEEYQLAPGDVLFIPAGAMHEVVACGQEPCVSVSFHMGSPHPLLVLAAQLNKLVPGGGDLRLPAHMRGMDKFELWFFEPTWYREGIGGELPAALREALLDCLASERFTRDQVGELLSAWWRIAQQESIYLGPYPPAGLAEAAVQ